MDKKSLQEISETYAAYMIIIGDRKWTNLSHSCFDCSWIVFVTLLRQNHARRGVISFANSSILQISEVFLKLRSIFRSISVISYFRSIPAYTLAMPPSPHQCHQCQGSQCISRQKHITLPLCDPSLWKCHIWKWNTIETFLITEIFHIKAFDWMIKLLKGEHISEYVT